MLLGLTKKKNIEINVSEISKSQIETKFLDVLDNYGILEEWIKKQKIRKIKNDSLNYKYVIKISKDIPIPMLLKDLNIVFENEPIILKSTEKKVHGFSSLFISSGDEKKLMAEFKYYSNITRGYSSTAFLIIDFEEIAEPQLQKLFILPQPFGAVLPLEIDSPSLAEKIKSSGYNYFIELDDDSDNIDFELEEDIQLNKLNSNIKKIISSFNSPRIFFINKTKSGFSLSLTNYIKEEFGKRNRNILTINNYILLKGENSNDLKSLLNFHLNKLKMGDKKIFRINYGDWLIIQNELNVYVKKGNKIVYPTKLL